MMMRKASRRERCWGWLETAGLEDDEDGEEGASVVVA